MWLHIQEKGEFCILEKFKFEKLLGSILEFENILEDFSK